MLEHALEQAAVRELHPVQAREAPVLVRHHRQLACRLHRRCALVVLQRLAREKVIPARDHVQRRGHDAIGVVGAQLTEGGSRGPERSVVRVRLLHAALEKVPPFPKEEQIQLPQRLVHRGAQEAPLPPVAVQGAAEGDRARVRDDLDEVEPEHEQLQRDCASLAEDRWPHHRLRDDRHEGLHLSGLACSDARPGGKPEVRGPEDGDASIAPRLGTHPAHRLLAVLALVLDGHEIAIGAKAATRVLQEHGIPPLRQHNVAPVGVLVLRAIGRANDDGGEGTHSVASRWQPQRPAQQVVAVVHSARLHSLHLHLEAWRAEP